ncbi:Cyanovirin-N [Coniella lustricola]|uniref:Cyanovirin-N n=1 Tax=Coniella lustricola TaxID=2025994 RepID=A0A2T3ABI3_9PEZI|nr:Cyanovirin-N [Coniella lustricola]
MSNFHHSCEIDSCRVENGHILRCRVARADGEFVESEIDLNSCIGNEDGSFQWGAGNFSESAEEIRFEFEGDQPILRARLRRENGEWEERDINLTERIMNRDGCLSFEF